MNLFRKQTLKIAFDALYGLSHDNIATHELIELIAYLHFDGKIEQGSKFEIQMSETVIDHLKNDTKISGRNLAMCWIFCKAHAREPSGISIQVKNRWPYRYMSHIIWPIYDLSSTSTLAFFVERWYVEIQSCRFQGGYYPIAVE